MAYIYDISHGVFDVLNIVKRAKKLENIIAASNHICGLEWLLQLFLLFVLDRSRKVCENDGKHKLAIKI